MVQWGGDFNPRGARPMAMRLGTKTRYSTILEINHAANTHCGLRYRHHHKTHLRCSSSLVLQSSSGLVEVNDDADGEAFVLSRVGAALSWRWRQPCLFHLNWRASRRGQIGDFGEAQKVADAQGRPRRQTAPVSFIMLACRLYVVPFCDRDYGHKNRWQPFHLGLFLRREEPIRTGYNRRARCARTPVFTVLDASVEH